ncbi:MAG: LysR family transcriptional regulator [Burkholderiaceae bacterium]|nr:LysR family transcriptional regulator [Burkholderiaceae bacterium]
MLDLNLLPVFEAMLVEQNVTAAASHVGLSQSAMSNALGRLRQHFGDPLFVKTRTGMLPTPRARELAGPLKQALALIRASAEERERFDPIASRRSFRLYMTDVGEMRFLPGLMEHLRSTGSSVKIETSQLQVEELADRMTSGEIDLALGYLPAISGAIERLPLFDEHYVCVTRDDGGANKLTLKRFIAASHVAIESMGSGHALLERALQREGIVLNVVLRVPHFVVIPMIVAQTDLVVTIPSKVAEQIAKPMNLRIHPLPFKFQKFEVSLFWHPRFANDPPIAWLRGQLALLYQEPPYAASIESRLKPPV